MTQVVSHWPLTAKAQDQSQAGPCGICDGQMALRQVFLQVLWFYPVSITLQMLHLSPMLSNHSS